LIGGHFPEFQPMSPLQVTVIELGLCPFCHEKSLEWIQTEGQFEVYQCYLCRRLFT